jgi:hypothetical protein
MERVGRLLCLVLLLSLPLVLGAVLMLLVLHPLGGLPATGSRSRHTMVHGRDRGTWSTHGTRASSVRNMLLVTAPIAADPAGTAAPAVLGVTSTPVQLGLLDRVTVATKLYNGGPIAGPLRRGPAIAVTGSWHWTEPGTGRVHAAPWPAADAVLGVAGRSITAAWSLYGAHGAARSGTIRPARGQRGTATTPLSVRRP